MKRFLLLTIAIVLAGALAAQENSSSLPPYRRVPVLPPFKLLQTDSARVYTKDDLKKNRPVFIMLFDPGCEHCKHETEEIVRNIDRFKKIQLVLASTAQLHDIRAFSEYHHLAAFENIMVGKDVLNFLPGFFGISNLPWLAFYNKKGKLIDAAEGTLPVDKILAKFDQN